MNETASQTRDRLIRIAMRLFHRQGYAATGIAQILKESKARSGSLYYFFPSKEDLLLAVLDRYLIALRPAVIEPVFKAISDPIERVFGVLEAYRQNLITTDFTRGCPIGNLALEVGDAHPEVRAKLAANFEAWKNAIRECLIDAGDRLPPSVDRDKLATFVLTTMEGAVMQSRVHHSLAPFEASVDSLRDYVNLLMDAQKRISKHTSP